MGQRKAVIFDWGGVLMRTEDYAPRHRWDQQLGLPPGSVERVVHGIPAWEQAQLGQIDLNTYWQHVAAELHLAPELVEQLKHEFYRGDVLDWTIIDLIRSLRARDLPVGMLSNNVPLLADEIAALEVGDLFDVILISCEIGVMKPDPRAYHAILDRLNVEAGNAIFIDDSAANVQGAQAVGMNGVHYSPDIDLKSILETWLQT